MNAQNRKKWIVLLMVFLMTSFVLYAKERQSRQTASRETKQTASASKESSQRQTRSSPSRNESTNRNQTAARSEEPSRTTTSARSSRPASQKTNSANSANRTSQIAERAASRATRSTGVTRPTQRYVEVDNSRAKDRAVSSARSAETATATRTVSSAARRTEKTITPGKSQTVGESPASVTTKTTARTENTSTSRVVSRVQPTKTDPVSPGKSTAVVTAGTASKEISKASTTARPARRTKDIVSTDEQKKSGKRETKTVVRSDSEKTSDVSPVRVTRSDMKDRTERVSTDQIRKDRNGQEGSESKVATAAREQIRQRVVTRIDRTADRDSRRSEDRSIRDNRQPRRDQRDETAIRTAAISGDKDRLARGFRPHSRPAPAGRRPHRAEDYDSRIVINGSKNVVVLGDVTPRRPRPYIPRRLHRDIVYVRTSPGWLDCGSFFSLTFSLNSCGRIACVPYGGYYGFTYYYPRYHRRYIFVSVGGWWPHDYRYRRYYWYGCHPYYWYGPSVVYTSPVVREYNTYNTYNYYGTAPTNENASTGWKYPFGDQNYDASDYVNKISAVDEPEYESAADLCFAHAVDLFTAGHYEDAAAQFREAIRISPDDIILPFTYSQALFADEDYAHAAAVLRSALSAIPEDELTIYYPRGLYEKEEYLMAQIAALEKAAEAEPFAADYHLLLGYQYLGIGDLAKAAGPLAKAAQDPANEQTAGILMELAARLEEEQSEEQ